MLKAAFIVVILLVFSYADGRAQSQANPCRNGHIVISYDDGPNPAWTPLILDDFKARSAQAVFLTVGNNGAKNRGLLERMVAEYHQIGSHAYNHERMSELSDDEVVITLERTNEVIRSVGVESIGFRYPFGAYNDRTREIVANLGIVELWWTAAPSDWEGPPSADTIVDRVINGWSRYPSIQETTVDVQENDVGGAIVAMHDGWAHNDRSQTVLATPRIIDEARSRGYCIGALDDAGNVIPATNRNITFGDEDSGVPNYARDGAAFLDWVWAQVAFDSHEQFFGVARELVYAWEEEGLFTGDERQAVLIAAMHSGIGR